MIYSPSSNLRSIKKNIVNRQKKRVLTILGGFITFVLAVVIMRYALRSAIHFYRTPSEITIEDIQSGRSLRLGGFVKAGTVQRYEGVYVCFKVTDYKVSKLVQFTGVLPDLFRENQGVVVEGYFDTNGIFNASRVLAKHDEYYIPKDVVDRLNTQGLFMEYINRAH